MDRTQFEVTCHVEHQTYTTDMSVLHYRHWYLSNSHHVQWMVYTVSWINRSLAQENTSYRLMFVKTNRTERDRYQLKAINDIHSCISLYSAFWPRFVVWFQKLYFSFNSSIMLAQEQGLHVAASDWLFCLTWRNTDYLCYADRDC